MKLHLRLILCAFGVHRWCMYCCRSREAERDTRRECAECGEVQERATQQVSWSYLPCDLPVRIYEVTK